MSDRPDDANPDRTPREISRDEARRWRARLLAAQEAASGPAGEDELDPADASLATLILPGG